MKKLLAALVLTAILLASALVAQAPVQDDRQRLFREIETILADLQEITGLKPLKPVPHEFIARAQVKQFLEEQIKAEVRPEELRAEELTLKMFGFVPADFDLKKATVDLLTEQAAAFYDFRKKRLYVLESAPEGLQQVALVHELAHALADQHFNLEKYTQHASESDDGAMARMAVMEGQATWLMSEYAARRMGLSLRTSPGIVSAVGAQMGASAGQFPVFEGVPLYLQESLLFPYLKGMLFQHAVIERDGQAAFTRVFEHPPASTQQILHPEKYFAGEIPSNSPAPAVPAQGEYRTLAEGSIGEFDHAVLLRQYAGGDGPDEVASRWKGGSYRLLEHKKNGRTVLAYSSDWADAAAAREYFRLYRKVLKGKWKTMEVLTDESERLTGQGDDGYFDLRLAGVRVTCLEGLASAGEAKPPVR
jgi:hypothetical protein